MRRVDVAIVGSGPVGCAFARTVHELRSRTSILVVDAGPVLREPPGSNVRNILDLDARARAQALAQGRVAGAASPAPAGGPTQGVVARPGTHLVREAPPGASEQDGMPAAAMSTNVGGMGAHWTCSCPAPGGSERISFLDPGVLEDAEASARRLLAVTQDGFAPTTVSRAVLATLRQTLGGRTGDREVAPMPLACTPRPKGLPRWSGADTVLGDLARGAGAGFELGPEMLCRRVLVDGDRAAGVELEDLATGAREQVAADVVVVAADALRTPQVLWASGIRPPALGRYLNDQPQTVAAASLRRESLDGLDTSGRRTTTSVRDGDIRDHLVGVAWVPFADDGHPWHGQVMQLDTSPISVGVPEDTPAVVGLGWFCAKELRAEDRVAFSDHDADAYGMPAMTIHYGLTPRDERAIHGAMSEQRHVASALGALIADGGPRLLPAGSSLHYQGSVRMGAVDDGTSVCDRDSRVWGLTNLFVGGNGVIPSSMACNPTLTGVALATIAARRAVGRIGERC